MSSLILLGEQSAATELATLLTRLQVAGVRADAEYKTAEEQTKLVQDGVIAQSSALASVSDDDYTAVLHLSFAILRSLPAAAASSLAHSLAKLLVVPSSAHKRRQESNIRTLNALINVLAGMEAFEEDKSVCVSIMQQMMEMALEAQKAAPAATSAAAAAASPASPTSTSPAALVLQPLPALHALCDAWRVSAADRISLFQSSYRLASSLNHSLAAAVAREQEAQEAGKGSGNSTSHGYALGCEPVLQHDYLYALLETIDGSSANASSYASLVTDALIAGLATGISSTIHTLDLSNLLQLPIVAAVPSASNIAKRVAQAIVDGDLAAFDKESKSSEFGGLMKGIQSHANAVGGEDAVTVTEDDLRRRARVFALAALAVSNQVDASTKLAKSIPDNVLTYEQIRQRIGAKSSNEDVEESVIEAVMSGRMEAKMDQEAETILVKRVVGGVPLSLYSGANSSAAWSALGLRLSAWKSQLHAALLTMSSAQMAGMGMAGVQGGEEAAEEMQ